VNRIDFRMSHLLKKRVGKSKLSFESAEKKPMLACRVGLNHGVFSRQKSEGNRA